MECYCSWFLILRPLLEPACTRCDRRARAIMPFLRYACKAMHVYRSTRTPVRPATHCQYPALTLAPACPMLVPALRYTVACPPLRSIKLGEHTVVKDLDIVKAAGSAKKAHDEYVEFEVSGSQLKIGGKAYTVGDKLEVGLVKGAAENPKINGIVVTRGGKAQAEKVFKESKKGKKASESHSTSMTSLLCIQWRQQPRFEMPFLTGSSPKCDAFSDGIKRQMCWVQKTSRIQDNTWCTK